MPDHSPGQPQPADGQASPGAHRSLNREEGGRLAARPRKDSDAAALPRVGPSLHTGGLCGPDKSGAAHGQVEGKNAACALQHL